MSRDSKKLFVQHFVKVFDQNRKQLEMRNQRISTLADFAVATIVGLSEAATRGVVSEKVFIKILQCPQETPVLEFIFKKVADS